MLNPEFLIAASGTTTRAFGASDGVDGRAGSAGPCAKAHTGLTCTVGRFAFATAGNLGRAAIIAAHPTTIALGACHLDTRTLG